ncbi:hypothetical protein PMZ80_006828 [Knufia obscura]|uniref:Uncharacterized protein n=2 Tax=Knufia TaxID=430999 RepID=A0AAN8EJY2_9EURO|nr:hypothetical protein PMZ80_006828 [Knufia obscura]KAK5957369.1 hypothetical protein OHC33_001742 [Knufia fluminis]
MSAGGFSQAVPSPSISTGTASPSTNSSVSSNGQCSSAGSGSTTATSVSSTSSTDLPSSSYDGTHLHWKAFRRDVLAPHRICVVESPPSYPLPESLLALIDASRADVGKFDDQKRSFQEQVIQGRGFGPITTFPTEPSSIN